MNAIHASLSDRYTRLHASQVGLKYNFINRNIKKESAAMLKRLKAFTPAYRYGRATNQNQWVAWSHRVWSILCFYDCIVPICRLIENSWIKWLNTWLECGMWRLQKIMLLLKFVIIGIGIHKNDDTLMLRILNLPTSYSHINDSCRITAFQMNDIWTSLSSVYSCLIELTASCWEFYCSFSQHRRT